MQDRIQQFVDERDWSQFHSPRNLVLALVSEVGELADLVRWKSDDQELSSEEKQAAALEIADIAIFLVRLSKVIGIDLIQVMGEKIDINEKRYPLNKSKGNATKYTEL
jgi:NTP pyrophosphatase (non-canonical NTP hydrolase)